jgi:hypothetical protein
MGVTPPDKIARWVQAAGQTGKPQPVIDRVVIAGEFLEKTARMSEPEACECISGIDFSHPVTVVRLPALVYVQYAQHHRGVWFTNTGLTPDQVGLAAGRRRRRLFTPIGTVHALQSTARSIKDTWTVDRLLSSVSPIAGGKLGQMTRGGGMQYVVHDKFAMREI